MLPPVEASNIAEPGNSPKLPPLAVKLTLAVLDIVPLAAGVPNVISWRLYPLPVTSVPVVVEVGATVYRPR